MPNSNSSIDICLYHCDRPNIDCARFDSLPRGWCAYARACEHIPTREVSTPPPGIECVTTEEAAEMLGVVKQTVIKRIWKRQLPAWLTLNGNHKRQYLIPKEAIREAVS